MENLFHKDERTAFAKRIFRKIFLEDWLTKLIALGITLALWFGVTGLQKPTTIRFNNLTLQPRLSNNFEITNLPVTEVALVITGDKRKTDDIKSENLIVSIDLTDAKAGEQIIQLTPETVNVALPTGVKVVEVQPNKIAVKIEMVEEREIPVRAETEGKLAEGFEIYNTVILPQKVRVRAPSSFIKSLEFISTEKINIDGRQTDFTAQRVQLNILNPRITAFDTVVDVSFRINEKRLEKSFLVSVQTDGSEKKVSFTLYGARSVLENLTAKDLPIEISKTDSGEYAAKLTLPDNLTGKVEIKDQPIFKTN
jgi:YbbR domain-containing protein